MKKYALFLLVLFGISSCEEPQLFVKKNYLSLDKKARYLGECKAKYDDRSQMPIFTKIKDLPWALISMEYDSNKILLNKKISGPGIKNQEFYDKLGNVIKLETFVDDQPQRLYKATFDEQGRKLTEYDMEIRNNIVEKHHYTYSYTFGTDSNSYEADVREAGNDIFHISQTKIKDTTIITISDLNISSAPMFNLKEEIVYDNEKVIWKRVAGKTFTYEYNEEGKCTREIIRSKDRYGNPQKALRSTGFQHGLISFIFDKPGNQLKFKLSELKYDQ